MNHCILHRLSELDLEWYDKLQSFISDNYTTINSCNEIRLNLAGFRTKLSQSRYAIIIYALWKEYAFLLGPANHFAYNLWFRRWRNLTFITLLVSVYLIFLPFVQWIVCGVVSDDNYDECIWMRIVWSYCILEVLLLLIFMMEYLPNWYYLFHIVPHLFLDLAVYGRRDTWNQILFDEDKNIEIMDYEYTLWEYCQYVYYDILDFQRRNEIIGQLVEDPISAIIVSFLRFEMDCDEDEKTESVDLETGNDYHE